ncbi:MAG TPA: amidohydrolase family protein [Terracidiphilus sp.]|jgi:L-fuconolactonase|nr:amidohydrolase family protein [Terracidiphilus sp.]
MMRIDAHQHFWRYDPVEYGWIGDSMAELRRDFVPSDLKPLLDGMGFDGCVAVQASQSLEETRRLLEFAQENEFVCGVVGWVDLRSPELPRQLEQFARDPKLVGVRHVVQDEADDEFMLRADFRRGIARLAEFDLAYDVLIYPRQLRAAALLANDFPQQRFVLDHIAKPLIAQGALEPWESDLRALAEFPNIGCKVSGMVTEARWNQWRGEDFRPYLDVVFEAFGPGRIMIGSDWPVCTVAADYGATMGLAMDYVVQFSREEQEAILGGNCAAFYRLPSQGPATDRNLRMG